MTEMTDQPARGSDKDYCDVWPTEGHNMAWTVTGGKGYGVGQCQSCRWIDTSEIDEALAALRSEVERLTREKADLVNEIGRLNDVEDKYIADVARLTRERDENWDLAERNRVGWKDTLDSLYRAVTEHEDERDSLSSQLAEARASGEAMEKVVEAAALVLVWWGNDWDVQAIWELQTAIGGLPNEHRSAVMRAASALRQARREEREARVTAIDAEIERGRGLS